MMNNGPQARVTIKLSVRDLNLVKELARLQNTSAETWLTETVEVRLSEDRRVLKGEKIA